MSKPIIFPDGTKCYSGVSCRKHKAMYEAITQQSKKQNLTISKTFSYLLRHNPEKAHLTLDENGWVDINVFIESVNKHMSLPEKLTVKKVEEIVKVDSKQRYSLKDGKIRASQGHSVNVDLMLQPKQPPIFLYHGTNVNTYTLIQETGLKAMKRQYVHLSDSMVTAENVAGRRKGETVILKVNAEEAFKDGVVFYQSENNVWLVESLPAKYVTV